LLEPDERPSVGPSQQVALPGQRLEEVAIWDSIQD
jgi:hypothetical protein